MIKPEVLNVVGAMIALAIGGMIMVTLIPWDESNPQKKSKKRK